MVGLSQDVKNLLPQENDRRRCTKINDWRLRHDVTHQRQKARTFQSNNEICKVQIVISDYWRGSKWGKRCRKEELWTQHFICVQSCCTQSQYSYTDNHPPAGEGGEKEKSSVLRDRRMHEWISHHLTSNAGIYKLKASGSDPG